MKKRITGLLLTAVLLVSVFAGCGAAKTSGSAPNYAGVSQEARTDKDSVVMETTAAAAPAQGEVPMAADRAQAASGGEIGSIGGGGDVSQDVSNAILSERKVIRSANVTVEVENFDEAYSQIDTIILGIGFIQSTNINSERYYKDGTEKLLRRGTIVIRVDREKFDKVLNSLKGIGKILSWNINGDDVTDKYFDTESRLRLLRIEESKLEEYLKKLTDLDQIFKTESRLTDIRYQIEALTGNLKKMNDLVELSTISININEKRPDSDVPVKPKTYSQKLLDNFLGSTKGVAGFVGDLVIVVVAAIPVLILLGVFALVALLIYRRIPRKRAPVQKEIIGTQTKDDQSDSKDQ